MLSRAPEPMFGNRTLRLALLWALLGALCCALVSGFEPNLLEEGIELHVAQRLAQGERLYRDVLVFTGPLPFELLGWLFRAFGEEIWVARGFVILLHTIASGAAFALARAAQPGAFAHAAAAAYATAPILLFPLFGIYYYTTIAFHLSVLAALAAARGLRSPGWAAAAGVLIAGAALCKQTIGVSLALSFAVAFVVAGRGAERTRGLLGFALGGAGSALLAIAAWAAAGTLDDAIYGLVTLPASLEDSYDLPYLNLWPPGVLSASAAGSQTFYLPYFYMLAAGMFAEPGPRVILATQIFFALPLLALAVTGLRFFLGRPPPAFVFHAALALAWLANLVPRTDWGHLAHVLPLTVAQLCLAVPAPQAHARLRLAATRLGATLVIACAVAGSALALRMLHRVADPTPLGARVPLRPVSAPLREDHVRGVLHFLGREARPEEPIFVARAEPLIYFATNTRNPTRYPGVFPAIREEQQRSILAGLDQVRFVVMSDVDQPAMTYYRDELPDVQSYLERHFRPAAPFVGSESHWLYVLERGPDRGATAVDFAREVASGRPFTRGADGALTPAPAFADRIATRRNRRPLAFQLGPFGGGIDFDVDVPQRAVFQADVSLDRVFTPARILSMPQRSRIVVSIGDADGRTPIAELQLQAGWSQRWIPIEADLAAWAGKRATLRIELRRTEVLHNRADRIGYVGSPRIALRADPE